MPTKDELEAENAELKARLAELETADGTPAGRPLNPPRVPQHPDFGISAGEVADLQANGVTTSPFTGSVLNALDLGITPGSPEALRNAQRERASRNQPVDEPLDDPEPPKVPAGVKALANDQVDAPAAGDESE